MVDGRKASALTCALLTALLLTARPASADAPEGCGANAQIPSCTYVATTDGGVSAYAAEPGGWKVTIIRKKEKIVISSLGGPETYACGAIAAGDKVTATANEGSGVFVGNPGICF